MLAVQSIPPSRSARAPLTDRERALAPKRWRGFELSPEKVVGVTKDPNGKIVWLEAGSIGDRGSGLAHIIEKHGKEFNGRGISNSEIPRYLLHAVNTGKVVGMQGRRPVYEFTYNGMRQQVAITVSVNGYIVGANLRPRLKEN